MSDQRAVKISFDLIALQYNFELVKKHSPQSKIMPVIKANAYGHGMLKVAQALNAADGFAVAQLKEAIYLREHGINKPITVFQGFANHQQLLLCYQYQLTPAISQIWQIDLLENEYQTCQDELSITDDKNLTVWLKVNTGMGRLGLQPLDVVSSWRRIQKMPNVNSSHSGLMMHFANADIPEHASNQAQINCFKQLMDLNKVQVSVSNSAAIISHLYPDQDWLRPGIMLYGASPLLNQSAASLNLKPVMSVTAQLIAINLLEKGQTVGYGDDWVCPQDMPVGIVNIGYGDGYPRHATSGTPIAINGQLTQLIGRVSMDSIAIDLRHIQCQCGDEVECWGNQVAVDEVAKKSGTIAYELLCQIK